MNQVSKKSKLSQNSCKNRNFFFQIADVKAGREEVVKARFVDDFLYWFTTTSTITSISTSYSATTTFTIDGCTPAGSFSYTACGWLNKLNEKTSESIFFLTAMRNLNTRSQNFCTRHVWRHQPLISVELYKKCTPQKYIKIKRVWRTSTYVWLFGLSITNL